MFAEDTIAAISTPYGSGGIGIIRISGEKAFEIAGKIFKGRKSIESIKSHTINYGKIVDPKDGSVLDEVLLTKMKAPNTFTREDVIEINCHGGIVVLRKILELVIREGARLAEPGEFTKRAFLNGRIDLAQAEAIIDIINAKTVQGSKIALEQLEGKLSEKIKEVRDRLIELIAHIEATLDYPEEDFDKITEDKIYKGLNEIKAFLSNLLLDFDRGRVMKEGIKAVIAGRPNVGKSSLLNQLAGYNRAIVTDIPGTTRDIIEEYINIRGIPVKIVDTAGIRETGDVVEKIGVEKTRKAIESADLVILMIDAVDGFTAADTKMVELTKDRKAIILLNKADLVGNKPSVLEECREKIRNELKKIGNSMSIIETSMKDGKGIDELENEISRLFLQGEIEPDSQPLITNVRHAALVEKALASINYAISGCDEQMPMDCVTIDIRNAAQFLGEITGESVSDEILNQIFERFCIGK